LSSDDFGILKHHVIVPEPKRLTVHQYAANPEKYEGQLIRIDSLYKLSGAWPGNGAYAILSLADSAKSDTIRMFIDSDTDIDGSVEPVYPVNVVGIASQYSSGSAVNDGYQVIPRRVGDIRNILDLVGPEKSITEIPARFELYSNYPNPFNPGTTMSFDVPKASFVSLKVFNLLGQKVATIVSSNLQAGKYRYRFDAGRLASGVYIYQLRAGEYLQTRKMILMK